jgi:hypothetical protein
MPVNGLDLEALLNPDEDFSDPVKRQATAAALRRQQGLGMVGQLMGVQPTMQAGAAMQENAQGSLRSALAKQQAAKEAAARASERKQAQDNWQAEQTRQQKQFEANQALQWAQEKRARDSANQDAYAIVADPVTGGFVRYNKKTGEVTPVSTTGGAPSPGGPSQFPQQSPNGVQLTPLQQAPGKPPTEAESKTGMRGGVSTNALQVAQGVINRNPGAAKPGIMETAGTLFGLSPEQQQLLTQVGGGADRGIVRSAVEGFVDSALTEITGAAYTPAQLATYRARFMPTILDTPKSRQQKTQQMVDFVRQQSNAAGRAWTPLREQQLNQLVQAINMADPQEVPQGPAAMPGQPGPSNSGRNFEAEYGVK